MNIAVTSKAAVNTITSEQDSNLWSLEYGCSALQTELHYVSSQLGTGHVVSLYHPLDGKR